MHGMQAFHSLCDIMVFIENTWECHYVSCTLNHSGALQLFSRYHSLTRNAYPGRTFSEIFLQRKKEENARYLVAKYGRMSAFRGKIPAFTGLSLQNYAVSILFYGDFVFVQKKAFL